MALDGLPVLTATADAAYVGPALGGLALWRVPWVLEEFGRVLRAGGRLRVAVHDLDAAVRAYRAGDRGFFWSDEWVHPSGALVEHLLAGGTARSLFTGPLVAELLELAGFAEIRAERFGVGGWGDEELARPDRLERHCRFAEATWPGDDVPPPVDPAPSQTPLSWADTQCRSVAVTWCGPAAARGWVELRGADGHAGRFLSARPEPTIDGARASFVFRAASGPLQPGARYAYDVVHEVDGRRHVAAGGSFSALPPGDAEISFAFVADTGIAGRADGLCDGTLRMVEELGRTPAAFVLAGGDLAYRSSDPRLRSPREGVRAWLDQMAPVAEHRPLAVQFGNHEIELGERLRDWGP